MKKLNLVDIGVIVIAALIIIAAAILLIPKGSSETEKGKKQTVVMEVKEKTDDFCKAIKPGEVVKDPSNMKEIGKIISVEQKASTAYTVSSKDASFVKTEVPDRYDLYITLELDGVADTKRIGKGLAIRGKTYVCQGYIVDVIKGKENSK